MNYFFHHLSNPQTNMQNSTQDVGYPNWESVPKECHACESGIDVGEHHLIIVDSEEYIHPGCILNTEICYGCCFNSVNDDEHIDFNTGFYHKNCYCMSTR